MSDTDVRVTRISEELPHPNADNLSIYLLEGYDLQVVGAKSAGNGVWGAVVVYFPPDTVLPKETAEAMGVWGYLSPVKNQENPAEPPNSGRVRAIKLRGEPSFGFFTNDHLGSIADLPVGTDVSGYFGATKWVPPPPKMVEGKWLAIPEVPGFDKYTDIQNLRHHPDAIPGGLEVVVMEKIHGTCTRFGFVDSHLMAGCGKGLLRPFPETVDEAAANWYWCPMLSPEVMALLQWSIANFTTQEGSANVTFYGETYGPVQKGFSYGAQTPAFVLFDIKANGRFLNWLTVEKYAEVFGVPTVPVLWRGAWGPDVLTLIEKLAEGPTLLGAGNIREGVVVKPVIETVHPKFGRLILKYKSTAFLTGKGAEQEVGEV